MEFLLPNANHLNGRGPIAPCVLPIARKQQSAGSVPFRQELGQVRPGPVLRGDSQILVHGCTGTACPAWMEEGDRETHGSITRGLFPLV